MDASKGSLGAILSQTQSDGKDKPVAFASHVLFPQETRYAIMELKTGYASHFHAYLYGQDVEVFTDHLDVKAMLQKHQW